MDKIKSLMGSSLSSAKNDLKGLDKNALQEKAKTFQDSAQQKINDNVSSPLKDAAKRSGIGNAYDQDFDDFDVMDKTKSLQNKVPGIQGLSDKGNQMSSSLQSKGNDMMNRAQNQTDYLNNQMAQQTDKLKSMLGTGSKPLIQKTRAGLIEDDVDSSREEWKLRNVAMEQIHYQMDASKNDIKNYKIQTYKAGNLQDDYDSQEAKKVIKPQTFKAGLLEDDEELKIKKSKYRAGELEDDFDPKVKVNKFRAGDLLDDIEEKSPPKNDRELEELRRRNERLQEGNQSLKSKNHELEDELAREIEKNRELKRRLQQSEYSPPKQESPKKAAPPRRPLGSPKTELYNKQSVRSPNKRSEPDSGHRPEQLSPGALIRKRIEEDENLSRSYESPSRLYQSNVTTPMEYFSPVKKETPNRNYPYSPELSIRPFRDHDLLPNATNPVNLQLACLRDHEILYEDDVLLVESKTQYVEGTRNSDPLLLVAFSYTNKTANELKDFSVTYKTIHNVVLSAESTDAIQRLNPRETQTHRLDAVLVGPVDAFGFMVVEYRSKNEPHQLRLHSPIVLTKFAKFQPISSAEFVREKKILQSQFPENYEESSKIRLSQKNLRAIKDNLLSKMTLLETDDERQGRFTIYGGSISLSDIRGEALVRLIIENETQLLMVQLNYEDELEAYAKGIVGMFSFMCNEKAII